MSKFPRYGLLFFVFAVVISIAFSPTVLAEASQASYTVNLNYLTVNVTYPSQVLPGDNVTVNVQATAKRSLDFVTLNVQIFYSDGNALHQVTSTSANSNYMNSGASMSKSLQFTVPQDAPRTSLVASLTEDVQSTYGAFAYSFYAMDYNSSNCYYYPDWYYYDYGYCNYYGAYPYYPYYYAYPSGSYSTVTDSGVSPLSYIKAPTPEYTMLQSQYQSLQQQIEQSQAQNQQLNQSLQNAQNTIAQQNATISDLNQQLGSSRQTAGTFGVAAAAFAVAAVGIFVAFLRKRKGQSQPKPGT